MARPGIGNRPTVGTTTLPGTKKRVPLFDEDGHRIRGADNKKAANLALARVKLGQGWRPEAPPASPEDWLVAKTCSEYLQYCERGVAKGSLSKGHRDTTKSMLNDLCRFCGALPVTELKNGPMVDVTDALIVRSRAAARFR